MAAGHTAKGVLEMENIQDYIRPELLVLIPVLYIVGMILKNTEKVNDKFIPCILGALGIVLSAIYCIAMDGFTMMVSFTSVTQGILVTGAAVFVNQLFVQRGK